MPHNDLVLAVLGRGGPAPVRPGQSLRVLGIDLGTTNSTLAEARWATEGDPPRARPLEIPQPTPEGTYTHLLVPSMVALHEGTVYVGEGAKRLRSRAPELGLRRDATLFYDCKNEIGNRRTYHRAPQGYRSPGEIGARVLRFMKELALEGGDAFDRVVVTVPASFQAAQRRDTLEAARKAGLDLAGGDLLDEPVAAFLDYLIAHGAELIETFTEPRIVAVFDFGGGTCDVAVFRLTRRRGEDGRLDAAPLAVSRYHRLGGGDLDAAIVHEVLIPELCRQNGLDPVELGYHKKKHTIEPALLGLAEMLKVGLCIEIRRLRSFGKYEGSDKNEVAKTQPGVHRCTVEGRTLSLSSPRLTAAQLEALLEPFLDRDLLYARETEYRMTCSVFAPLQDAIERAGLEPDEVDYCLAVGGSSLIPQVVDSLKEYIDRGRVLTYDDRDSMKTCVSKGAAYHALAMALFGRGLVRPVCHDGISIKAETGLVELIPKGAELPYPADGSSAVSTALAVPKEVMTGHELLRLEVVATGDERRLMSDVWSIPGFVAKGSPIRLEYRLDENQELAIRARLEDDPKGQPFAMTVENPLTNVVNPQPKRLKIEELEEKLRTGGVRREDIPRQFAEIAELCADLGQHEKAIEFLQKAIAAESPPDVNLLNRLASYHGQAGHAEREEKVYREACRVSPWSGSWFNLSLTLKRHGKHEQAKRAIDEALARERSGPYLVQAALVASALGNEAKKTALLTEAMTAFGPLEVMTDWELGWCRTAAQALGDEAALAAAREEQKRRNRRTGRPVAAEGELPIITPGIVKRTP